MAKALDAMTAQDLATLTSQELASLSSTSFGSQARVEEMLRIVGKVLYMRGIGEAVDTPYHAALSALIRQVSPRGMEAVDTLVPALGLGRNLTTHRTKTTRHADATVDRLLQLSYAPSIGMPKSTTPAAVAAQLASEMTANGVTAGEGSEEGFAAFFQARYGVALPVSAAPTIPDGWITGDVIE